MNDNGINERIETGAGKKASVVWLVVSVIFTVIAAVTAYLYSSLWISTYISWLEDNGLGAGVGLVFTIIFGMIEFGAGAISTAVSSVAAIKSTGGIKKANTVIAIVNGAALLIAVISFIVITVLL